MSPPGNHHLLLQGALDPRRLSRTLGSRLRLDTPAATTETVHTADSFDGQLHRAGQTLLVGTDGYLLLQHGRPSASGRGHIALPTLVGRLRPALSTQLAAAPIRALLKGTALTLERRTLAVLDDQAKTVARLQSTALAHDGRVLTLVEARPVRGYVKSFERLLAALAALGLTPAKRGTPLLPGLGCPTPAYRAKPRFRIRPEEPCQPLARRLCRGMIDVARQNEAGIRADLDSEFLHDYRVSLRRARSVISLFRDVFPAEETGRLKGELAELMRHTNRLRDLDVYLLDRARYFGLLPDHLHPGLERMFRDFARERRGAQRRVGDWLASEAYLERIRALQRFFRDARPLPAARAEQSAGELAGAQIWKRYRKVCRIARRIDADTPDERVHALRIQCKKLRYLMEFFAPLYPKPTLKALVRGLKGLQDNLGRFNDYAVQQRALRAYLEQRAAAGRLEPAVADAIGALRLVLNQQQHQERTQVMTSFAAFHSGATHQTFRRCFHHGEHSPPAEPAGQREKA